MLTTPLTAYGRSPDGNIQVEAEFTFSDPTLVEFKGEMKYIAKCLLVFRIGVRTAESPWNVVTDATDDLTEEALKSMHLRALGVIRMHTGPSLIESFHAHYRTGFSMKLEDAFISAIKAIGDKVEAAITDKPERVVESAFDNDRQFTNTSRAK